MWKPSQIIRRHLDHSEGGFELDDLMTRWSGGVYDEIMQRIISIHQKFRTEEYPIGTSNPDSYAELGELAGELEAKGL
jgi:hypothetical protein